jgi:site-specific recombinase XerD
MRMRSDRQTFDLEFNTETAAARPSADFFEHWLARRAVTAHALRESSRRVYAGMWERYVKAIPARYTVLTAEPQHVEDYIAARVPATGEMRSPMSQWRILAFLAEVYQLAREAKLCDENPAQALITQGRKRPDGERAPPALQPWDTDRVRRKLAEIPETGNWQDLRDLALLNVVIGSGLKVVEVRLLRCPEIEWGKDPKHPQAIFRLPGHGMRKGHDVPASPQAAQSLRTWVNRRATLGFAQDYVFPGAVDGKPISQSQTHRIVSAFLKGLGIGEGTGGLQLLRNTFATSQLQRGKPAEAVSEWMGFADPGSIERFSRKRAYHGRPE